MQATAAAAVRKHSEGSTLRSQGGGGSSTGSRKTSTISTNRQISWGDVSSMGESSPDLKIFTITDFTTLESKQKYVSSGAPGPWVPFYPQSIVHEINDLDKIVR